MENNPLSRKDEDFNVKGIINKLKDVFDFIKLKFLTLITVAIFGGLIGLYLAYQSKPIYPAITKFILKETDGSSKLMSSLGSLGSLFGGASGPASPMDRTLAVLGSERVVGAALFHQIVVDGKRDLAINHLIKIYDLHKKWEKDSMLNGIIFLKPNIQFDNLDFAHRKAYKQILNILIGKKSKVIIRSFDKKSGVFEQTVNISNEEFSINFSKSIYKELESFLYNQSVLSSSKNVTILTNKIDSIKAELNSIQNSFARTTDRTLGLLMQEDKVDQKKLLMKEQMLTIMYGEAQKNLETFKFMNESINPVLELLETPFSPIKPIEKSKVISFAIWFIFFGTLSFAFLYLKQWIQEQL